VADVRKRLLRPAPKRCGSNRVKPGILGLFTQFRRMTETLVDHVLNGGGSRAYPLTSARAPPRDHGGQLVMISQEANASDWLGR